MTGARQVRRGEIYWVDFHPARGSEQTGRRPALVVQNDIGNRLSRLTVVVALTTRILEPLPPQQALVPASSGLPRDSSAKCDQLVTVDKTRLLDRAGAADAATMRAVDDALRFSLALDR
ncbi:MAG: type II toxin-antitoxin system PemK/MazF family toxin [Thermoleophilaceae bacterium]